MELTKIQKHVLEVVDDFLSLSFEKYTKDFPGISNKNFAKEFGSLHFQLPRRLGSTTLCIEIYKKYGGTIIVPCADQAKIIMADGICAICPINVIKSSGILRPIPIEAQQSLQTHNLVIMDAFKAYRDNSAVNELFSELGKSHRFIIFG